MCATKSAHDHDERGPELVLFKPIAAPPVCGRGQAVIVKVGNTEGAVIQDCDVARHLPRPHDAHHVTAFCHASEYLRQIATGILAKMI